jgi:multicomponent K+:H+ antiporter subunit G
MTVPPAVEMVVALLLVASGVLALIAAAGLLHLRRFFQRMHPPALASTLAAWCVTVASVIHFSALSTQLVLYPLVINLLVAITAPVTTLLLARAALLRQRRAGADAPPPLLPARSARTDAGPRTP